MSILQTEISKSQIIGESLISEAIGLYNHMSETYTNGTLKFWKNPECSPAEIAGSLGNKGKELFLLHYQLGQLLNSINPGSTDSINNIIGNFTINEDGTITIL